MKEIAKLEMMAERDGDIVESVVETEGSLQVLLEALEKAVFTIAKKMTATEDVRGDVIDIFCNSLTNLHQESLREEEPKEEQHHVVIGHRNKELFINVSEDSPEVRLGLVYAVAGLIQNDDDRYKSLSDFISRLSDAVKHDEPIPEEDLD